MIIDSFILEVFMSDKEFVEIESLTLRLKLKMMNKRQFKRYMFLLEKRSVWLNK